MALNEKQKRFVEEYLLDLNATQAAIRAGYSTKRASEIGYQLLQKTTVQNEISKAKARRSRRTGISQDRVVEELAKIAFVNFDDVIDVKDGSVKSDAAREDLACIQTLRTRRIENDMGTVTENEVRMVDKLKALELLGRHLGMFTDKVELSGIDDTKRKLDDILMQMRGDDVC